METVVADDYSGRPHRISFDHASDPALQQRIAGSLGSVLGSAGRIDASRDLRNQLRLRVLREHAAARGIVALRRAISSQAAAVRNAISEEWSNGQTEGQVNRLKALKRAMYGRASVKLLCARMRPLCEFDQHQM